MEENAGELMSCIVVGNSPEFAGNGKYIDQHDIVIRTGVPIFSDDTGYKADMLVTRERRIHETPDSIISRFGKCIVLEEPVGKPDRDKIVIFYNNLNLPDLTGLFSDIDILYRFNISEKPTLGIIACSIGLLLSLKISIIGVVTNPNNKYISTGHYNDLTHIRSNNNHNIYKEILAINKMSRSGTIEICKW